MEKETITITACLDRFEGKKAVLLLGNDEKKAVWPRQYLPSGLADGDYLKITIAYDEAATEEAADDAASLLAELRGDD